ncbi:MAG: transglutaminase-like domain-containing protein [Syntrophobacteraceae bacterium]|nr:transglutaminase-like domain-containing protein [Syntrophobacteraceae bacterium]
MRDLKVEFTERILAPEGPIDLGRAGLLISRLAYPDLDEPALLAELDALGARLGARVAGVSSVQAIARAMGEVLCEEAGFRGNSKNYYDPDNSYLSCVLDRRTGIPATLSLVYMEVGRRAGLDVRGIGLPGHFLVCVFGEDGRIFVDPFYRGIALDEKECRRRAAVQHEGALVWNPRFLQPLDEKAIIVRLLRNLKGIYGSIGDDERSFQVLEWIIALDPNPVAELKTRGFMYESLGAFELAAKDLRKVLDLQPDAPDAAYVQSTIEQLSEKRAKLH